MPILTVASSSFNRISFKQSDSGESLISEKRTLLNVWSEFSKNKTTNVNILLNRVRLDRKKDTRKKIIFLLLLLLVISAVSIFAVI